VILNIYKDNVNFDKCSYTEPPLLQCSYCGIYEGTTTLAGIILVCMSVDENNRAVSVNLAPCTCALQHSLLLVKGNIIILLCMSFSMNVCE